MKGVARDKCGRRNGNQVRRRMDKINQGKKNGFIARQSWGLHAPIASKSSGMGSAMEIEALATQLAALTAA